MKEMYELIQTMEITQRYRPTQEELAEDKQRTEEMVAGFLIAEERARKLRESSLPQESDVCSMCGEFCSMKGVSKYLKKNEARRPV